MEDESEATAYKEESLATGDKAKDEKEKEEPKATEEPALKVERVPTVQLNGHGEEQEKQVAAEKAEADVDGEESNSEEAGDEDGETKSMPNILIREGEQVLKKKVSFDESKNVIKEFAKNEKIQSISATENVFSSPKKAPKKKGAKSDKPKEEKAPVPQSKPETSEEGKSGGDAAASAPAAPAKKVMTAEKVQSISNLKTAGAVLKAKDDLLLKEAPNSFY